MLLTGSSDADYGKMFLILLESGEARQVMRTSGVISLNPDVFIGWIDFDRPQILIYGSAL